MFILFTLAILTLSESQPLSEKLSYGESSRSFCHDKGGEYMNALFSQDQCYVNGHSYEIYYDHTKEQWRLAD